MVAIIGHRGASADAPENTLSAFELARRQGADGVELDVQLSADGIAVVHHDARWDEGLAAPAPAGRAVADTPAAERPAGVPTLAEVLAALEGWDDALLNIEVKADGLAAGAMRSVVDLVTAVRKDLITHRRSPSVLVSSFDGEVVQTVRRLLPTVPVGWLLEASAVPGFSCAAARSLGCAAIHPHWRAVDAELVARAHAEGLAVHVWTVDDAEDQRRLARLGVDGIITNRPAEARRALRAAGLPTGPPPDRRRGPAPGSRPAPTTG